MKYIPTLAWNTHQSMQEIHIPSCMKYISLHVGNTHLFRGSGVDIRNIACLPLGSCVNCVPTWFHYFVRLYVRLWCILRFLSSCPPGIRPPKKNWCSLDIRTQESIGGKKDMVFWFVGWFVCFPLGKEDQAKEDCTSLCCVELVNEWPGSQNGPFWGVGGQTSCSWQSS